MPTKSPLTTHATTLEAHEAATSGIEPFEVPTDSITPELVARLNAAQEIEQRLAELKRREEAFAATEARVRLENRMAALRSRTGLFKIGGRDGATPVPDQLDIIVEVLGPDPSVPNLPRQIAWVPVPLGPVPVIDPKSKTSQYGPTATLGSVSVAESTATALIATATPLNPSDPTALRLTRVSLKAFANITINPKPPEEVLSSLDSRDSRHLLESVTPSTLNTSRSSGLSELAEAATPAFQSSPLTTYEATRFNVTSPVPPRSTNACYNPPTSPSAPFDPTGLLNKPNPDTH
jgi:hypothetical protein